MFAIRALEVFDVGFHAENHIDFVEARQQCCAPFRGHGERNFPSVQTLHHAALKIDSDLRIACVLQRSAERSASRKASGCSIAGSSPALSTTRSGHPYLVLAASATESGFTYTGGSYNDLLTFMQADPCLKDYIGKIIPRNACRGPWTNTLDGKLAIQLPFNKVKAEITLDALNLINLFDNKGGLFQYASFNQLQVISSVPTSVTATAPFTGYNLSTLTGTTFTKFFRDDLRSRWQLQLGGRIRF